MSAHCQFRVWDNGNMTTCGKYALRGSRCPDHLRKAMDRWIAEGTEDAWNEYRKSVHGEEGRGQAMSAHCQARVWDNGDMTTCGKYALRGSRCPDHLQEESRQLMADIKRHQEAIDAAKRRLAELNTESG